MTESSGMGSSANRGDIVQTSKIKWRNKNPCHIGHVSAHGLKFEINECIKSLLTQNAFDFLKFDLWTELIL